MYPNSSILGRPPYKRGTSNDFLYQIPLNLAPALFSQQQLIESEYNSRNANFHSVPLNVLSRFPSVSSSHDWNHVNHTSPQAAAVPTTSQGRKSEFLQSMSSKLLRLILHFERLLRRRSDEHCPFDVKRQRFQSPLSQAAVATAASSLAAATHSVVHLQSEGRSCAPAFSAASSPQTPKPSGCVPPLRGSPYPELIDSPIPAAKDKLSQQILELFQTCQQQSDDLEKKELCRAELQREIQRLFPQSRVYLAGSSLNGFGSRSSDADLCLVVQEGPLSHLQVDQRTNAIYILSLVQQLFYRLSYIERPQLIRAKVPILKFRDKVSGVEFDLNVNNVVGIRNTFLLRTYAFIENRVRPLILVVKKWARHHGINDASRGTLSSYSLVLMVLHYLQTLPEPVIPCLQKEYPECFNSAMQLHLVHEGPRNVPQYHSKNRSTIGDLLLGFLKYYATVFNWDKCMISVREAKALPKPGSNEWKNKFICVEEPFDGSNTARAVHEKMKFDAIKTEFMESWQQLQVRKDLNVILPVRATIQKR
ncbi:poly(A) RNA polymerase GLD2 isoform X3 [Acipenser ruthenus]|nr:poly(A) RNA polymerase GLD2 isoform X3 [Acipenser ruthenus]